jgi:O-antigen ligase
LGAVVAVYAVLITVEAFSANPPAYAWFTQMLSEPVRPDMARVHLGRGTVALALLTWPLALALRGTRPGAIAVVLLLIAAVVAPLLLNQHSAVLALAAGGVVFAVGAKWGPAAVRAFGGLAALVQIAAPWAVLGLDRAGVLASLRGVTPASTDARLDIWTLVSERVAQNPLRGWGLDASRLLPPPVSLHPHNGPLQIWLELGAHGAVLAALVWWALFDLCARAARNDRPGGAAAGGAATAYFVIGALSFGVWQEWWLGLGAVTAAVCAAVLAQRRWERMALPPSAARLRAGELQPL